MTPSMSLPIETKELVLIIAFTLPSSDTDCIKSPTKKR